MRSSPTTAIALTLALFFLGGCTKEEEQLLSFEIRDVKIDSSDPEKEFVFYTARGQVISTSSSLKGKTIILKVSALPSNQTDNIERDVVIRDGSGIIEVTMLAQKLEPQPTIKKWSTVGYAEMKQASIIQK